MLHFPPFHRDACAQCQSRGQGGVNVGTAGGGGDYGGDDYDDYFDNGVDDDDDDDYDDDFGGGDGGHVEVLCGDVSARLQEHCMP